MVAMIKYGSWLYELRPSLTGSRYLDHVSWDEISEGIFLSIHIECIVVIGERIT